MPQFCRHNRFIERCPICSKDLPELPGASRPRGARGTTAGAKAPARERSGARRKSTGRGRSEGLRVYADGSQREQEDGYSCELVPGLRASEDARRLVGELAFASARLWELATSPDGPYREAHELGRAGRLGQASWLCFLIAYLSPAEGDDPFAGIAQAFAQTAQVFEAGGASAEVGDSIELDVDSLPLGPRTSHREGAGTATIEAYRAWAQRAGSQERALAGDHSWSAQRRFERLFERLALPGLSRAARFEMLVLLGRLDLYQLSADSLHLAAAGGLAPEPVLVAAKRIFGIGDAINMERRAATLAQACGTPIEALELALFNWGAAERATLGMPDGIRDEQVEAQALQALGL